jgi:hypothetical protein
MNQLKASDFEDVKRNLKANNLVFNSIDPS